VLRQRILTALVLIPAVIWAVLQLPTQQFAALLAVLVLMGAWEWSNLAGLRATFARVQYVVLVAMVLWMAWWWHGHLVARGILFLGFLGWLLALAWISRPDYARDNGPLKAVAGFLVLVPAWLGLVLLHAHPALGPRLVLFLMVLIWVADSGAYFAGRRWGRHKLAPRVSPGKTWEGVYGALAACALVALAGAWWMGGAPRQMVSFLLICLVTILFSIAGDLLESLMKRQRGIKDSGQLLPGHGGVLDRVDSLTAAAPVFVLGLYWTELWVVL
jgi:phosphatidate cytidylyltransferase